MKKMLFTLAILSVAIACGNNSAPSNEQENSEVQTSNSNKTEISPCELISESALKELLAIPDEAPTEMKDVMRTYPTCFYKWESVPFSETKTIANKEMDIDFPSEATIVLVKNATDKMYERSIKVYKDGASQDGIGEMAIWGGKMSQLTFLAEGYLIHLYVKVSSDEAENKAKAQKIASQLIQNL
jgi:hypothetical protein